jgi:hypothetical protein
MPLPNDVRDLADRILGRLDEARDFYLHTRQAWRVVQQLAHEGRPVGIVETASGQDVAATDLEAMAQRYVTVHLSGSAFKGLSSLLEDWMIGLGRLWLTAYPVQLNAASNDASERPRSQRQEIQIPLSDILDAADRDAILGVVIERVLRDLAHQRPAVWFRFLDNRVNLGCPDETQRSALYEMKAARDVLEHNRGLVGEDYREKAGPAARYAVGETIQIEEPYLLQRFELLRDVLKAMADAAVRKSSGPSLPSAQVEP